MNILEAIHVLVSLQPAAAAKMWIYQSKTIESTQE